MKVTYTFALLEVSHQAYDEIERLLREAGYDHAFGHDDGAIDMHGIALTRRPPPTVRELEDILRDAEERDET